jgi:myo-inositol 2-dehydrogenase/D-chiro-inositol 1-dehydrogenase
MDHGRRSFLAALGASGLAAGTEGELRAAMIGVGHRGKALLQQVLAQPDVKVAAICDIDATARDEAQSLAKRDNPRAYTDYRQVLDLRDIDAVLVATPCDLHSPMAVAALQAGKYVYCEKPLGITPEQVKQAVDAQRRAGTFLQIGLQLRYMPGLREAVRHIRDGAIGQPFVIRAQRDSTPVPPQAEAARPAWYKDVKRSGDLIVENAVHNLDVCNWLADSHPASAYGHGKNYLPSPVPAGTVMMDGFSVEYIYENDMHLVYDQLYLHPRTLKVVPNGQWYLVHGEKGTLDVTKGTFYPFEGDSRDLISPEVRDGKENAMSEFFACIREKRKPYADIHIAATAALTAIMGREAIYRRRMVTWKEVSL